MAKDRRFFSRIKLNIDTTIFFQDGTEILCTIYDISETGICLILSNETYISKIKIGDFLKFQSIDTFKLFDTKTTEFFNGSAKILRIQKSNDKLHIGCKFTEIPVTLEKYIKDKKIALFIENGCKL